MRIPSEQVTYVLYQESVYFFTCSPHVVVFFFIRPSPSYVPDMNILSAQKQLVLICAVLKIRDQVSYMNHNIRIQRDEKIPWPTLEADAALQRGHGCWPTWSRQDTRSALAACNNPHCCYGHWPLLSSWCMAPLRVRFQKYI